MFGTYEIIQKQMSYRQFQFGREARRRDWATSKWYPTFRVNLSFMLDAPNPDIRDRNDKASTTEYKKKR